MLDSKTKHTNKYRNVESHYRRGSYAPKFVPKPSVSRMTSEDCLKSGLSTYKFPCRQSCSVWFDVDSFSTAKKYKKTRQLPNGHIIIANFTASLPVKKEMSKMNKPKIVRRIFGATTKKVILSPRKSKRLMPSTLKGWERKAIALKSAESQISSVSSSEGNAAKVFITQDETMTQDDNLTHVSLAHGSTRRENTLVTSNSETCTATEKCELRDDAHSVLVSCPSDADGGEFSCLSNDQRLNAQSCNSVAEPRKSNLKKIPRPNTAHICNSEMEMEDVQQSKPEQICNEEDTGTSNLKSIQSSPNIRPVKSGQKPRVRSAVSSHRSELSLADISITKKHVRSVTFHPFTLYRQPCNTGLRGGSITGKVFDPIENQENEKLLQIMSNANSPSKDNPCIDQDNARIGLDNARIDKDNTCIELNYAGSAGIKSADVLDYTHTEPKCSLFEREDCPKKYTPGHNFFCGECAQSLEDVRNNSPRSPGRSPRSANYLDDIAHWLKDREREKKAKKEQPNLDFDFENMSKILEKWGSDDDRIIIPHSRKKTPHSCRYSSMKPQAFKHLMEIHSTEKHPEHKSNPIKIFKKPGSFNEYIYLCSDQSLKAEDGDCCSKVTEDSTGLKQEVILPKVIARLDSKSTAQKPHWLSSIPKPKENKMSGIHPKIGTKKSRTVSAESGIKVQYDWHEREQILGNIRKYCEKKKCQLNASDAYLEKVYRDLRSRCYQSGVDKKILGAL